MGTVRVYGDGTTIEDRCRILEHYESKEQDGVYYDWYTIDSHYRMCSNAEGLRKVEQQVAAEAAVTAQTRAATRLYVQKATDITDEQALTMADLFLTWEGGAGRRTGPGGKHGAQRRRATVPGGAAGDAPKPTRRPTTRGCWPSTAPSTRPTPEHWRTPSPLSTAWTRRRKYYA